MATVSQLSSAEEGYKAEILKLKTAVEAKNQELHKTKNEKTIMEQMIEELNAEVQQVKQLLSYEREHRVITEQKAAQLIKCMKTRQKHDALRLRAKSMEFIDGEKEKYSLESQLEDALYRIDEFTRDKADMLEEIETLKHRLLECQKKCSEREHMVSVLSVEENEEDAQNTNMTENKHTSKMQDLRRLIFNLEKKNVEIERDLDQTQLAKKEIEAQVLDLQNAISELQSNVQQMERQNIAKAQVLNSLGASLMSEDSFATASETNLSAQQDTHTSYESVLETAQDTKAGIKDLVQISGAADSEKIASDVFKESGDSPDHSSKSSEDSTASGVSTDVPIQKKPECFESSLQLKKENEHLKLRIEYLNAEILRINQEFQKFQNLHVELEKQLKEKDNELSEAKIDLRISTRKEQQAESTVASLRERNKELREKFKSLEDTMQEKIKAEEELRQQLKQMENDLTMKVQEITEKQKQLEIEKAKHEERVKAMQYTCEISKDVTQKFAKSQDHYEEVIKKNMDLLKIKEEKNNENFQLREEMKKIRNELTKKTNECTRLEKICSTLRSECTEMEKDCDDLQIIMEARDKTISGLNEQLDQMKLKMKRLEENLKESKADLAKAETKCEELLVNIKELTSEMDNNNLLFETEMQNLQDQILHYKKVSKDKEDQNAQILKELSMQNKESKGHAEKIMSLESQLCEIKEEAARHISQIASLKTSNLKLTQALEEAIEDNKDLKHSYDNLCNDLEGAKANHCHEKVKLQETVAQQTKLIDFLQSKAENLEKRKRPHLSRLFGKKDNTSNSMPMQYRDVEKLLDTERSKCRRLQDQLSQLQDRLSQARAENVSLQKEISNFRNLTSNVEVPVSPMSRAMHCAITQSPSNANIDSPVLVSRELVSRLSKPPGMKHKIPHRFSNIMCMKSTKCCACLDSVHFGRPIAKCQECSVICHPTCAMSLPSTCGLPSGFLQHFRTAVSDSSSSNVSESDECRISEGWIKVPKEVSNSRSNKLGWDRRYLRIIDKVLYMFENSEETDTNKALIKLDFCPKVAKIVVTSAVSATEMTYAASSDLPFVMKLEYFPHTTCWPQRCFYIMALNFSDKQMWVSTLEHLAEENQTEVDCCQKNKLVGKAVWTLKGEKLMDPLCTYVLDDNIVLLGAMDGLYVLKIVNKFTCSLKCKVDGLQYVYQIACLRNIGLMVMIQGIEKRLTLTQMSIVHSTVQKPLNNSLISKPLSDIHDVHLFSVEETFHSDAPFLCIATSKSILLYQWDTVLRTFCSRKVIETDEPCICIHFTQNSVIIGTDSFYELNLNVYTVKKFLDDRDASLAGLIYGASQFRSFPINIFQVSASDEAIEYLMCFHEMGVFVNANGQRTRPDDMKWSRLPLSFAYQLPYLFVTHFNSLEVIEIPPQTATEPGVKDVMMVKNPQLLGPAYLEQSVFLSSCHHHMIELILVDGKSIGTSEFSIQKADSVSLTSSGSNSSSCKESIAESEAMDFSFSTSIDQSLAELSVDQTSLSSKASTTSTDSASSQN